MGSIEELKKQFCGVLSSVHSDDLLYFKVAVNKLLEERLEQEDLNPKRAKHSHKHRGGGGGGGLKYLTKEKEALLGVIIQELRNSVPVNAEAPNEKIIIPTEGPDYEGFTGSNTVHVDCFLYEDEEAIDELCDAGKMARSYCLECGSHKTKPLNFISHSISLAQLRFIFGPKVIGDIAGKVLVDVGSRLGAVLYTGHLMTKAKELIGIEINEWFAKLQQDFITKKFKLSDRIKIIHADVLTQAPLLATADVVVMNNVFEFFEPSDRLTQLWEFIRGTLTKKGTLLITIPSLHESLAKAKVKMEVKNWVKEVPLDYPQHTHHSDDGGGDGDDGDDDLHAVQDVHLYTVM